MPTIIDGSGSADFQTPLPLGEGGTGSVVGALSGPNGSAFALRNRIINGDMRIDQRNGGAAVTAAGDVYFLDRFRAANSTGSGTITVQQSTLGSSRSMRVTATTAVTNLTGANYAMGPTQGIEAQNVFDLNSKTATLSFQVETNWTGNLAVSVSNASGPRSYVVDVAVVSGTNTATVVVPFEANTIATNNNGLGVQVVIGFNNEATWRTATTGAWIAGGFFTSTSSTQWAKTTGNFINVTNVQLEEGSVATPFERRPIGLELALCQRYFEAGDYKLLKSGYFESSLHLYLVQKRVAPTMVSAAQTAIVFGGGSQVSTAFPLQSSVRGFFIGSDNGSGQSFIGGWTASAEL